MCLDCDDYDIKEQDLEFINTTEEYCIQKEMDLVWFCKDIERVYIGRKVANSAKKDEATRFKARKLINNVSKDNLIANTYSKNKSNIVKVLRKYLDEK